jgi:stearoyl-CoA desaturase (delta-9 desaturase)
MKRTRYSIAVLPFALFHLVALNGLFLVKYSIGGAVAFGVAYFLGMFGITAGYHRYFSHRSYETSRPFQFLLALLGTLTAQKGVLWWAGNHRHHHTYSDQPEDVHSPRQRGFVWSHVGWILSHEHDATRWDRMKDFAKVPELVWLNKYNLLPSTILGVSMYLIGGTDLLYFGFFFPIVALWHATFCINSLTHIFGRRVYATTDDSKNSLVLGLLTLGEGWHNNHHHYQHSARQGFRWYEIDISYYVLRALAAIGLVWNLREVPAWALEGRTRKHPRRTTSDEAQPERLAA